MNVAAEEGHLEIRDGNIRSGASDVGDVLSDVRDTIDTLGWLDEGEKHYFSQQEGRYRYTLAYLQENTRPGQVLLDVGSHALHLGMAASAMGLEVWGTDIGRFADDPIIRRRRDRLGIRDIRACDLSRNPLPYQDACCDIVNFSECLEHFNFNPLPGIKEFHRVLKPAGLVIVTTPNATRIGKRLSFLMGRNVAADLDTLCHGDIYSVHFREYTLDEVCRLIEWAGFRAVKQSTQYLYPASGVRRVAKKAIEMVMPGLAGTLFVVGQK